MSPTSTELANHVRERTEELNCLYGPSKLVEVEGVGLASVTDGLVALRGAACNCP